MYIYTYTDVAMVFVRVRRCRHILYYCCHMWPHVDICCHILFTFFMKVHDGKLRRFCDDPVCPDPVWKLSSDAPPTRSALPSSRR